MAKRYVYYLDKNKDFVKESFEFEWFPGFSISQKQKSSQALKESFLAKNPDVNTLEVSSASTVPLGQDLSAFNLEVKTSGGRYTVEQVFQAAKYFEVAGSQERLLQLPSREAKKEIGKIQKKDTLKKFSIFEKDFPLQPQTFFYNWIYLYALNQNEKLAKEIMKYQAFTDIQFNPQKQINCQAEACSIFVSLKSKGLLKEALDSKQNFLKYIYNIETTVEKQKTISDETSENKFEQLTLSI